MKQRPGDSGRRKPEWSDPDNPKHCGREDTRNQCDDGDDYLAEPKHRGVKDALIGVLNAFIGTLGALTKFLTKWNRDDGRHGHANLGVKSIRSISMAHMTPIIKPVLEMTHDQEVDAGISPVDKDDVPITTGDPSWWVVSDPSQVGWELAPDALSGVITTPGESGEGTITVNVPGCPPEVQPVRHKAPATGKANFTVGIPRTGRED